MSYYTSLSSNYIDLKLPADFFENPDSVPPPPEATPEQTARIAKLEALQDSGEITLNQMKELDKLILDLTPVPEDGFFTNKYGHLIIVSQDGERADLYGKQGYADNDNHRGLFSTPVDGTARMLTAEGEEAEFRRTKSGKWELNDMGHTYCNYAWVEDIYKGLLAQFKGDFIGAVINREEGGAIPLVYQKGVECGVKVIFEITDPKTGEVSTTENINLNDD